MICHSSSATSSPTFTNSSPISSVVYCQSRIHPHTCCISCLSARYCHSLSLLSSASLVSYTFEDDMSKGYVIQVPPHNFSNRSIREWYLPHHPVVKSNKPGKVRRVLNGASKFHGTSLKKSLLVGPDLMQKLMFVLLRFRQYHFAVSADIEGMYLQVGVLPEDQPSLRFMWREDPTADVVVHQ